MLADSGFYAHAIVAACRKLNVRFSITIRQHQSLRNLIEAIPEADWTPVPLYLDFGLRQQLIGGGPERGSPVASGS